jgi:hypothetical protein
VKALKSLSPQMYPSALREPIVADATLPPVHDVPKSMAAPKDAEAPRAKKLPSSKAFFIQNILRSGLFF